MNRLMNRFMIIMLGMALMISSFNVMPLVLAEEGEEEPATTAVKPDPGNLSSEKYIGSFTNINAGNEVMFVYQDSFFNKPSTEENPSLATMSQVMAMSAFNAADCNGVIQHEQGYRNLERVLTDIGFENFEANEDYKRFPGKDTMGVGIATKYIELSDGTVQPIIAVAFRGGNYQTEWAGNITVGTSGEAEGFAKARDRALDHLLCYLDQYYERLTADNMRSPKLWLAGYSRSSAAATLSGSAINWALSDEGYAEKQVMSDLRTYLHLLDVKMEDVYVYGFSVPRAFRDDGSYMAENNDNIWNYLNKYDLVTQVAPDALGFRHAGHEIYVNSTIDVPEMRFQMYQIEPAKADKWLTLRLREEPIKTGALGVSDLIGIFMSGDKVEEKIDTSVVGTTYDQFVYKLVNEFLINGLKAVRDKYYPKVASIREFYATYYQPALAVLASFAMSATEQDLDTVIGIAMSKMSAALSDDDYQLILMSTPAIVWSGNEVCTERVGLIIRNTLTKGLQECAKDPAFTAIIPQSDINTIISAAGPLGHLITRLLMLGAPNEHAMMATTLIYMDELFEPHMPEYMLGYLRCNDPNYRDTLSSYQLSLQSEDGGIPDNIKVKVFLKDWFEEEDLPIAEIMNGQVVKTGEKDLDISVFRRDDRMIVSVVDPYMAGYAVGFEVLNVDETKDAKVKIGFNYFCDGIEDEDIRQDFEKKLITLSSADKVVLYQSYSEKKEATFAKYITLTPKFITGDAPRNKSDLNYLEGGTIVIKDENDAVVDMNAIGLHDGGNYTFEVSAPEGYYFSMAALMEYGATGRRTSYIPLNNPLANDYDMKSSDLYLICYRKQRDGRVYSEGVVQTVENGIINEAVSDKITLVCENLTDGGESTGGHALLASPGDDIRIHYEANEYTDTLSFLMWEVEYGVPEDLDINGNTVRFTMPQGGVSIRAVFGEKNDDIRLTFTGSWAADKLPQELDCAWKQIYIEQKDTSISELNDSYNYPVKHVFAKSGAADGEATIKAPLYPSALMGDLNFSYWEVYNTKTGEPCDDKIALATKYNAETGQYESVLESANGFDEDTIRLVGIKEDLTLVPHYVTATYKLTMKTSAGEVTTAYYPAGTTIGLQDVPGDGYETYRWRVVHYPITETTDNYGNAVLELTSEAKLLDDAYEGKDYVLTMPRGDTVVTAYAAPNEYKVVSDDSLLKTASGQMSFRYRDTVTLYPNNLPKGKKLTGITVDDQSLVITELKKANGDISGFRFVMPMNDVHVSAQLGDMTAHRLEVKGGIAEGDVVETETAGVYEAYYDDLISLTADTPSSGKYFSHWSVTKGEESFMLGDETDAQTLAVMGDEDVVVEAVFVDIEVLDAVDLQFTKAFTNGGNLPLTAIADNDASADYVVIDWHLPQGMTDKVIVGYQYSPTFVLDPSKGSCFSADTTITLNGAPCTFTINEDGSVNVTCPNLTTPISYITDIGTPNDLKGLKAGTSLAEIASQLPATTHIIIDGGKDERDASIVWDMDNLTDANGDPYIYESSAGYGQEFYVKGTLDCSAFVGSDKDYRDGYLMVPTDLSPVFTIRVTTIADGQVQPARVTDYRPGKYYSAIAIHLECESPDAQIMYMIHGTDTSVTAQDILDNGMEYAGEIALSGNGTYRVSTMAYVEDESGPVYSEVLEYDYEIAIPARVVHHLTVVNGSGSGDFEYDGTTRISVIADAAIEGTVLQGYTVDSGNITIIPEYSSGNVVTFTMPDEDVTITFRYAINDIHVLINDPIEGKPFDHTVEADQNYPDLVDKRMVFLDENGDQVSGDAGYNTIYTAKVSLVPNKPGYILDNAPEVYINGTKAQVTVSDGSIIATHECTVTGIRHYSLKVNGGKAYDLDGRELTKDEKGYIFAEDDWIMVFGDGDGDMVFNRWICDNEDVPIAADCENDLIMGMPAADVELTATYYRSVGTLELTMDEPLVSNRLPVNVKVNTAGTAEDKADIGWSSEEANIYTATITIHAADDNIFTKDLKVNINGKTCSRVEVAADGRTVVIGNTYTIYNEEKPTPTPTPTPTPAPVPTIVPEPVPEETPAPTYVPAYRPVPKTTPVPSAEPEEEEQKEETEVADDTGKDTIEQHTDDGPEDIGIGEDELPGSGLGFTRITFWWFIIDLIILILYIRKLKHDNDEEELAQKLRR